jgi:nitrate reductase gamma subunit
MDLIAITRIIAIAGMVIGLIGIGLRLNEILRRPFKQDLARVRGSVRRGVLYAFTLGMAPWEKESTRIHWLAYLRGIFFHVGIFTAFAVLIASPWLDAIPQTVIWIAAAITGLGAIFGFAGIFLRLAEDNLRELSLPDDYFSVFLTSLFVALAFGALLSPFWLPLFYLVTGILGVYLPAGKIRHCVYFFYSKFYFGKGFGYRGVIGQARGDYAE